MTRNSPSDPGHEVDLGAGRVSWSAIARVLRSSHARLAQCSLATDRTIDLLTWAQTHLPDHFRLPPSGMHRWLAGELDDMDRQRGRKINVLGPRGGAKSTVATLAYVLRAAVECREPYVWILSDTRSQAHAHLENIKAELRENHRLADRYPQAAGQGLVWRAGAIVLRNGVAIEAFGTGQRIRGRRHGAHRPSLIVCDDLQNDSHIVSATQRASTRTWFYGTLLNAGTAATNVVNLATALHREALAMELHEAPGWNSRIFRAIESWPANAALWESWESIYADPENPHARDAAREFYTAHREALHAGSQLLWPEAEDLYTLMCQRAERGRTAFAREKQNSPINPQECEWSEDLFGDDLWFDQWPTALRVKVLALDPSKGADSRRGDFSAFIRLGVAAQGVMYVEADLARRSTPQVVADGVEHYRQFQPDRFGIEANQYQELLGEHFELEFERQGMLAARPCLINNQVNKLVRIRRLGAYLSGHRLRMKAHSPGTQLLVRQLQEFPIGDHDDGPDALEMAIRLAGHLLAGSADDGLGDRLPLDV